MERSRSGHLTFVMPVRHHLSVDDWEHVRLRMEETLASLSAQTVRTWRCLVVASSDTPLPPMPARCDVIRVTLPFAPLPAAQDVGQEARDEAVRADKGRRILEGLVAERPTGHVMVVDYDDFVSNRLAALVAQAPESDGWFVDSGYLYDGGPLLYKVRDGFNGLCGTSLIVNARLLEIPHTVEDADEAWTRRWLGSHIFLAEDLAAAGHPLEPVPFPAAVYRIGYRGNTSGTPTIRTFLFRKRLLVTQPLRALRRLTRLRPRRLLTREFFGGR